MSRVSEAEAVGYSRDHLFSGLRKPLKEVICAKFDNPMNDCMALMRAARKAEGEHEQQKHNHSCASKSGVFSDVPLDHKGTAILTLRLLLRSPGQSGLRCSSN